MFEPGLRENKLNVLRSALHAISNRRSLPCYGELPSTSEDSTVSDNFSRANVSRCNFIGLNRHKVANDFRFTSQIHSVLTRFHITFHLTV